jgi:predicted dehydrogenase
MSHDRTHRVALIGAGRIAAVHLGFAKGVPSARIVGICDPVPGRAEELAGQKQVSPFCTTDLDAMLRETEPSIVHVLTPQATHAELAIRAMEAGANVLVEKPMAMTVEDCDRMIAAARLHGRRICVDHNRLFDPVVLKARALVERGGIGELVSVEAHQGVNPVESAGAGGPGGGAHWSVENAFAPLYNLGPHPFYLVSSLIGPSSAEAVMGRATQPGSSTMSEIRVLLEGERAYGFVTFSMGAQPYLNHLTVFGTKATLRLNLNTMTMVVERVRKLPKMVAKVTANLDPAAQLVRGTVETVIGVATRRLKLYPGIGQTIRRFYKSLDEGAPPPVDGEAGRENVRLLNVVEERLGGTGAEHGATNGHAPGEMVWTS